ncbi:putative RdRp [Apple rootstock virus A]|uniref:RNA-directed RNA polymerase n=1 Tax=Apple rootstock virus A TaxID=2563012 RepID=A0A4D6DD03_9RHAB|nr:putative RdRp [Apple rootstock virus A]QBZ28538.1 putative RdRp [Apple rootstock virus A]
MDQVSSFYEKSIENYDSEYSDADRSSRKLPNFSPGSNYHCKAALRSHQDNLKLPAYNKDYMEISRGTFSTAYNEEYLKILKKLWETFSERKYDLDGIYNPPKSALDATASPQIQQYCQKSFTLFGSNNCILQDILTAENKIFGTVISNRDLRLIHSKSLTSINKFMHLLFFLITSITAMNHDSSDKMPNLKCQITGIIWSAQKNVFRCAYNSRFHLRFNKTCVELSVGNYCQIIQKDLYLNLVDKLQERINIIIAAEMRDTLNPTLYKSRLGHPLKLHDTIINIIKFGDDVIKQFGNRGFEILGKFEAYVVSSILTNDPKELWDSDEFQQNLLEDDSLNNPSMLPHARVLCSTLNGYNEHILSELHGLWRIWGHPIIDLVGGLKKMEETSLKNHKIDEEETNIGGRTFKKTFIMNYKKNHQFYPLTNVSSHNDFNLYSHYLSSDDISLYHRSASLRETSSSYIVKCIRGNKPISETNALYHHDDWDNVIILQNFQTPATINLATMIKDKAISMDRDELVQSVKSRNSVFDSEKRRGVLKWLSKQTIRVKEFLTHINLFGISENECIIGLYPKEREIKIKARFFSLMSYTIRMFVTITEELISHNILRYFPMITMSDSLLNMMIRLYNMTTPIGRDGDIVTYCMNIDFSKWNQNMRESTNSQIFPKIDKILGYTNLISRTHSIFKSCYLYLCSGEYVPRIISDGLTAMSPYSRIGDESGKEGLRQKGWTITTVCDIVSLAFRHRVKIELIGGGDNQVLTVAIRPNVRDKLLDEKDMLTTIKKRMESFRKDLAGKMEKRGLPLKLEETWISPRLLMYNKIMYLEGVPLSSTMKIVSRCFSYSNEGIMTMGNITSTLGTNFQSIGAKDYTPTFAWVFSRYACAIWSSIYYIINPILGSSHMDTFIYSAKFSLFQGLTPYGGIRSVDDAQKNRLIKGDKSKLTMGVLSVEELFLTWIYYHKVLGGPGIGSPYSYMIKGFPDPLSEALSFNYTIIKSVMNQDLKKKIRNITMVNKRKDKKWEHLLEDPVSINHDAPMTGLAALRINAESILRSTTIKNVQFKALLDIGDNEILKDLSNKLCSPPVLEPRLLHDIVGATIPGYVNSITAKVDQSTTLNKLSYNISVIETVYHQEVMYYIFMGDKIRVPKGHNIGSCPTEDSKSLRDWTWEKKIVGVTVPHPSSFLQIKNHFSDSGDCDLNYIMVQVKVNEDRYDKRGPFRPYFGSYTKEKFKQHALATAYGDEDILRRAIKIQKLLRWRYVEGSMMYSVVQKIIECITDADPNKFLPVDETITGDVEHRYNDQSTKHGGIPCNLTQLYTLSSCNTSTFINHSRGSINENIHFQSCIIYSCMTSILQSLRENHGSRIFHFHESCNKCITKLEHPTDEETEPRLPISLYGNKDNDLIYVKEADVPIHFHIAKRLHQGEKVLGGSTICDLNKGNLVSSFSIMVVCSIMTKSSQMTESSITLYLEKIPIKILTSTLFCFYIAHVRKDEKYTFADNVLMIKKLMEFSNEFRSPLLRILQSRRLMRTLLEEDGVYNIGQNLPESELNMEISKLLRSLFERSALNLIKNCLPSISDPLLIETRDIYLISNNKSINTCVTCRSYWRKYRKDGDLIGFGLCSTHGLFTPCKSYHIYSMDRISKEISSLESNVMEIDKRKLSISRTGLPESAHMTFSKFPLNGGYIEETFPSFIGFPCDDISINIFMKDVATIYGAILFSVHWMLQPINHNKILRFALESPASIYEVKVYYKALLLLHRDKSINNNVLRNIELILFIDKYNSLEGDMLEYPRNLSTLVTEDNDCFIKAPYLLEKHLETTWVMNTCNFLITRSSELLHSDATLRLLKLENAEEFFKYNQCKGKKSTLILTDEKLPGEPFLGVLMTDEDELPCSYSKFLDAFRDHTFIINEDDKGIGSAIMKVMWKDSMVLGFIREVIPCVISITNQDELVYYIGRLSNIIKDHIYFNKREGLYNWRVTTAIKVIIALKSTCSVNRDINRRSALFINGFNFVRGNNKHINILRSSSGRPSRFGRDIVAYCADVGANMHITLRTDFNLDKCKRLIL